MTRADARPAAELVDRGRKYGQAVVAVDVDEVHRHGDLHRLGVDQDEGGAAVGRQQVGAAFEVSTTSSASNVEASTGRVNAT